MSLARWKALKMFSALPDTTLLVENGDIDPTTLYVDAAKNELFLHRSIDNHDMTPAILRLELDHFMDALESSSATWSKLTH